MNEKHGWTVTEISKGFKKRLDYVKIVVIIENNDDDVSIFLPTEQKVRNNSFGFITSQEDGKSLKITIKIQINGEITQYEIEK